MTALCSAEVLQMQFSLFSYNPTAERWGVSITLAREPRFWCPGRSWQRESTLWRRGLSPASGLPASCLASFSVCGRSPTQRASKVQLPGEGQPCINRLLTLRIHILQCFQGVGGGRQEGICAEIGWNIVVTQYGSSKDTLKQLDPAEGLLVVPLAGGTASGGLAAGVWARGWGVGSDPGPVSLIAHPTGARATRQARSSEQTPLLDVYP